MELKKLSQLKMDEYFVRCLSRVELPVKIGLLFNVFIKEYDFRQSYRSFQRLVEEYSDREFIEVKRVNGLAFGKGKTTIINKLLVEVDNESIKY